MYGSTGHVEVLEAATGGVRDALATRNDAAAAEKVHTCTNRLIGSHWRLMHLTSILLSTWEGTLAVQQESFAFIIKN